MAAETSQLSSLLKHVRPNIPSSHFDAVRRRQVIRGTASAFLEEPLVYPIQSVGCVLRGREDEDSIVGERSRDAKGKGDISCRRKRRVLTICRSRSGRRCSSGAAAA